MDAAVVMCLVTAMAAMPAVVMHTWLATVAPPVPSRQAPQLLPQLPPPLVPPPQQQRQVVQAEVVAVRLLAWVLAQLLPALLAMAALQVVVVVMTMMSWTV